MSNHDRPKLTRPPLEPPLRALAAGVAALASLTACSLVLTPPPGVPGPEQPKPATSPVPHPVGVPALTPPPGLVVQDSPTPAPVGSAVPQGQLPFTVLKVEGAGQDVRTPETWVIGSQEAFQAFADDHGAAKASLPQVDFSQQLVVAVSVYAGCNTTIAGVEDTGSSQLIKLENDCQTFAPGPGIYLFAAVGAGLPVEGARPYGPSPAPTRTPTVSEATGAIQLRTLSVTPTALPRP